MRRMGEASAKRTWSAIAMPDQYHVRRVHACVMAQRGAHLKGSSSAAGSHMHNNRGPTRLTEMAGASREGHVTFEMRQDGGRVGASSIVALVHRAFLLESGAYAEHCLLKEQLCGHRVAHGKCSRYGGGFGQRQGRGAGASRLADHLWRDRRRGRRRGSLVSHFEGRRLLHFVP